MRIQASGVGSVQDTRSNCRRSAPNFTYNESLGSKRARRSGSARRIIGSACRHGFAARGSLEPVHVQLPSQKPLDPTWRALFAPAMWGVGGCTRGVEERCESESFEEFAARVLSTPSPRLLRPEDSEESPRVGPIDLNHGIMGCGRFAARATVAWVVI